jgi:hypothetical protein
MEIKDHEVAKQWRQYRLDGITNMVNKIAKAVHQTDKPLTAAVFPSPSIASRLVRQEWHKWDLDAVFPMLYYSFYNAGPEWLLENTGEGVEKLKGRIPLFAGLYMPGIKSIDDFKTSLANVKKSGAAGVAIFGGLGDEKGEVLRKYIP